MLVHDTAVLRDASVVAAVASATRLSASNVALREEVRAQAQELVASRRRLLAAADDERRRLEARLREVSSGRNGWTISGTASGTPCPDNEAPRAGVGVPRLTAARSPTSARCAAHGLHPARAGAGGPARRAGVAR